MDLSEGQKGYLAAMLDGEGTIMIALYHNKTGYGKYFPTVRIFNTNRAPLLETVGSWLRKKPRLYEEHKGTNKKPLYVLELSNKKLIVELLTAVKTHLIAKAEQAQLLLEFLSIRATYRKSPKLQAPSERENAIYARMRQLNAKGRIAGGR